MMEYLEVLILGIIQGATEFLPVSSSGHLAVAQHILGFDSEIGVLVDLLLHVGTLIAVFIAFRQLIGRLIVEFFRLLRDLFTGKFRWKEMSRDRRMIITLLIGLLPLLLFFIPLPGTEQNLKDIFEGFYSDSTILVEGICFLVTGILLMLAHNLSKGDIGKRYLAKEVPTVWNALTIGLFQGVATLPGISRSGSTLTAGILCGIRKQEAMEFSFVLGIPAILGASLLEVKDALEEEVTVAMGPLLVGMVVAALVGLAAIGLLKLVLKKNRLNVFAMYCFVLGIVSTSIAIVEYVMGQNLFTGTGL